jgi:hypothetical protein
MRPITSRLASWWHALAVLSFVLAAASQAAEPSRVIELVDERTLAQGVVEFQRGVFRVEDTGVQVTMLCIPVGGVWKYVGSLRDCGNPPPPTLQREITRFPNDKTFLGIRNLGIDKEQWDTAQKTAIAGNPQGALKKIQESFSFNVGTADVRWRFNSRKLPDELKTPIPGAAIAVHFGVNFSDQREPLLFERDNDALLVEARLSLPTFVHSGKAHSGVTVAVDLNVPTVAGGSAAVPVIVNLFHAKPESREAIRSDGRVTFVSSYLEPGNKYIQAVENHQRSASWKGFERFSFKLTRETLKHILFDANARRQGQEKDLFDETRVNQIKISSATLRNENRFLNEGDVTIEVRVDYVRLLRVTSSM